MITAEKIQKDYYELHISKTPDSDGKCEYILTKNNKNIATGKADDGMAEIIFRHYSPTIHYLKIKTL